MPKSLLVIISLAIILRLAMFWGLYLNFGEAGLFLPDSYGFFQTAKNLVAGHGFSRSAEAPFEPSAHFPPVYPLFIAGSLILGNSVLPLIFLQIIISSLLPFLVWKIGEKFTVNRKILIFASALAAFEPLMMFWSVLAMTEVVSLFFLLLSVWFFIKLLENWKTREAIFSGIFLGLSTLTRPNSEFIFIPAALYLIILGGIRYFRRKKEIMLAPERHVKIFVAVLVFLLAFGLTLSPWVLRNYYRFKTFNIATTGLRNVYSTLGPSILSYKTGRDYDEVKKELSREFYQENQNTGGGILENPALGTNLAKKGIKILLENPKATAAVTLIDLNAFFTQDLYTTYLMQYNLVPQFVFDFSPSVLLVKEGPLKLAQMVWQKLGLYFVIPLAGRAFWIILNIFWIIGAILAIKKGGRAKTVALILAFLILYYAATSLAAGFSDYGRHRYPANPFMFLLTGYGLFNLFKRKTTIESPAEIKI